ncbi:Cytochrome P450 monooxygenase CLM2 [Cladobotryum mycophilum]|uniref:Cytochrome P450 monooxygenase CLM2 n=1 Tax=Cladobotryum mycophilum TaxID=491253 RepID=A0ABR0SWA2_9HYPO
MEKKSIKTSGRPWMEFAVYCGFGSFMSLIGLTDEFKQQRKLMHQRMGTRALASKFGEAVELEARRLLLRTLKEPANVISHFKKTSRSAILKVLYGYTSEPYKPDPLVELIQRTANQIEIAAVPFGQPIDIIPTLKYLPRSLGFRFQKLAQEFETGVRNTINVPYEFVKRQMASGSHRPSFVSGLIEDTRAQTGADELTAEEGRLIQWSAGALYLAGADSTMTVLTNFLLSMVLHPEVQRKAQEEIDRVTGGSRLPRLEDRENLPYVEAIATETLRWCPVAALAFPHLADEDIAYGGYLIPKNAIIFSSTWWLTHDPEIYQDPNSFAPERYMEPRNEADPRKWVYGYGRRVCPGRHLAEDMFFLSMVNILSVYNIGKAVDQQGKEITPEINVTPGIVSQQQEFPYKITPRSEEHAELLRKMDPDSWDECDAELLEGLN